jgi:hypothetical protein
LGNAGASTEDQIVAIAQRFAAAGSAAGLSKEDILAFASATASMGIEVESAGSLTEVRRKIGFYYPVLRTQHNLSVTVLAFAGPWMMTTLVEYLQRTLDLVLVVVRVHVVVALLKQGYRVGVSSNSHKVRNERERGA